MRNGLAGVVLLLAGAAATALAEGPRAQVVEHADSHTELIGAAIQLSGAGFATAPLDLTSPPDLAQADLILVGSFATERKEVRAYLERHRDALVRFVREGGVLCELTQADQTEKAPAFLPSGLSAARSDEDHATLLLFAPEHPLLDRLSDGDRIEMPPHLKGPANWESFVAQRGFRVLLASDRKGTRPALLEAAVGRGRILLASLFPDKVADASGCVVAPDAFLARSRRFFDNLRRYVEAVRDGRAPAVVATPAYVTPEPAHPEPGSFTIAVLPDTQKYAEDHPSIFERQTAWIVENRERLDIRFVLHLGDITDDNNEPQWQVARRAMERLHGVVPYALVPGNHDYGPKARSRDRSTALHRFFPVEEARQQESFGGVYRVEPARLDNSYHFLETRHWRLMVLALEFGPREKVIAWANGLLARHPKRRVLLITHAYLYNDDTRYDWAAKGGAQKYNPHWFGIARLEGGVADGEELWAGLVSRHANMRLVIGGHVLGDGLGRRASFGEQGNLVHEMLVNYQMRKKGGEGYLRLLEFRADGRTVQVTTYSPYRDRWLTDPENQFRLDLAPLEEK